MIDFLDEVRHDISLAEAEKRHLRHSIQSLSSQVDSLMGEIDSNERELTYIINLFSQRRKKFEEKIRHCRLQRREQDEELSRTEHKISW
jgi:predicted  nucleic acid-binding Zn-ribbon protein